MTDIAKIALIDELYLYEKTGTIEALQHWVQTSTTTTTTGGPNAGTGYSSVPSSTTHTSSTKMVRMFVGDADGNEFDVSLPDMGFGVREGHQVSVIYAGDQASKRGYPMALVNHTTRKSQILKSRVSWISRDVLGCVWYFVVFAVSSFFGWLLMEALKPLDLALAGVTGLLVMFGGPFAAVIPVNMRRKRLQKAIFSRIETEVEHCLSSSRVAAGH